jgi:hypothetical protein
MSPAREVHESLVPCPVSIREHAINFIDRLLKSQTLREAQNVDHVEFLALNLFKVSILQFSHSAISATYKILPVRQKVIVNQDKIHRYLLTGLNRRVINDKLRQVDSLSVLDQTEARHSADCAPPELEVLIDGDVAWVSRTRTDLTQNA